MAPNIRLPRAALPKPPPPPPPGINYIVPIKIAVRDLLIAHSFSILLVALLIALLYFSTPRSRRNPVFLLNVFTVLLALAVGGLIDYQTIQTMIAPLRPTPLSFNIAIGVLGAIQSILVDAILLIRLASVYPSSYIGRTRFTALIALPVLLKFARVINLILFIKALADATRNPIGANLRIAQIWEHAPYLKIEWFSQLIDNTYASAGFLYRLALQNRDHNRVMSRRTSETSFADTIKTLLWVAATNFVVPVLFSLVQIIVVYRDIDVLVVNDIVLVNTSIAVIGVVFASVWAGTTNWSQDRSQTELGGSEPSHVVFQHRSELSDGSESTGRVEDSQRVGLSKENGSSIEFKVQ